MRSTTLALVGVLGLGLCAASANAAPLIPAPHTPEASNIVQVAERCGRGMHRNYRGFCIRNYGPYGYRGYYYRSQPYSGGGYERWNRPSWGDNVANQLNAREAHHGWGR